MFLLTAMPLTASADKYQLLHMDLQDMLLAVERWTVSVINWLLTVARIVNLVQLITVQFITRVSTCVELSCQNITTINKCGKINPEFRTNFNKEVSLFMVMSEFSCNIV